MDLVIDLGNTNKKLAIFRMGKLSELKSFKEIDLEMIREFAEQNPGIDNCILSSVIDHPESISYFLQERFFLIDFDEHTPLPIKNLYRSSETLGKDRLAAAVAGTTLFPGMNVLVINMGSCITYDFINSNNEYLGGGISPGMQMRFKALHTFTGKLPLVTHKESDEFIGVDTENSVLSGVVNGIISEIEGITVRYHERYKDLSVILSGGDLIYFDKRLKISIFAVPNIVLQGLYQILAFNVQKTN
jgi:type III pantothenate kinase